MDTCLGAPLTYSFSTKTNLTGGWVTVQREKEQQPFRPQAKSSGRAALSGEAQVEVEALRLSSCLMLSVFLQMTEGRLCQVHLLDGRKLELLVQVHDTIGSPPESNIMLRTLKDYSDVPKLLLIIVKNSQSYFPWVLFTFAAGQIDHFYLISHFFIVMFDECPVHPFFSPQLLRYFSGFLAHDLWACMQMIPTELLCFHPTLSAQAVVPWAVRFGGLAFQPEGERILWIVLHRWHVSTFPHI